LSVVLRHMLLAASASDRIRATVVAAPLTAGVVARYVAGDDAAAAVTAATRLRARGLLVTLDYLGEDTTDADQAAAVAAEYVALLARLRADGLARGGAVEVSVKPTAIGLHLPDHGEKMAATNLALICAAARDAGTTVTADMEDHTHVEATLRLVRELRDDYPDLGCVIQSQLRRSVADCAELAGPRSRVRLCKGAYQAPEQLAYPTRAGVDRSFARCLRVLMSGQCYPMIATHDPRLIRITAAQAELTGRGQAGFEYQMLYGVRPAEQVRLAGTGAQVRVYLPYGRDWYTYLVRRLAERPANLGFFLRSLVSRG
jgi:proline dehydrogenase